MLKGTILGAAAAVALAAGGATGQTNLVTNPSFEQDDPSGATAPLGWLDFNQSSTASTLYAHSGTRSYYSCSVQTRIPSLWLISPCSVHPPRPTAWIPQSVQR